jgi:hypothetical protein
MARGTYDITTINGVIAALGGAPRIIKLTGRSPQAISNWRSQGRIASDLYVLMTGALGAVTADPALWGQETASEEQAA